MRYIFTALRQEAAVLIRELDLKPCNISLQCYQNDNTILTVTGTGPYSAAAACGAVLCRADKNGSDLVINAGIAASLCGAAKGSLYTVNRIHDCSSGRDYYPDLVPLSGYPEAGLCTGAVPYHTGDPIIDEPGNGPLLYDMEGAGFYHAASLFLSPHRIRLLKLVSDFGDTDKLTFDPAWAEKLSEAVLAEAERMETVPARPAKRMPDCDALCSELHATAAMRARLEQALRYAELSGINWQAMEEAYRRKGLLPANDKETGKKLLEDFIHELQD